MASISACSLLWFLLSTLASAQNTDPEDGPVANSSPVPTIASAPNSQAGASGGNQGAYSLSRGGLIAIIVVVVVFALLGGEYVQASSLALADDGCSSRLCRFVLRCKEAPVGIAKVYQTRFEADSKQEKLCQELGSSIPATRYRSSGIANQTVNAT